MMIGKSEGTNASFINYQVNPQTDKEDSAHVSKALRGKTIGERNQERMAQGTAVQPYSVEISEQARNLFACASGAMVQLSPSGRWTREEELNALEKSVGLYQKMNENYRLTGSPVSTEEEQKRMDAVLSKFASGLPDTSKTAEQNGIELKQQDFGAVLKTSAEGVEHPESQISYIPVTEIWTQHYKWTEENGIEETVSREEEIAEKKESMQTTMAASIGKAIENILIPHETYEEAQEALYDRNTVSAQYSLDEDTLFVDMTLKGAHGDFGILANLLNNYLEEFGKEDEFFGNLSSALNELDPQNENELVNQIRKMVRTVQSGNSIDTESRQFKEDVENAISSFYGITRKKPQEQEQKKAKDTPTEQQGMSFLDMQRRAAEEEGQLLNKLLGEEHENNSESLGDILAKRKPKEKDDEFTDHLRRVDEREEPIKPLEFKTEKSSSHTRLSEEEIKKQQAVHDAWLNIGEKLVGKMPESVDFSLGRKQTANVPNVDILA